MNENELTSNYPRHMFSIPFFKRIYGENHHSLKKTARIQSARPLM